MNRRDFLKGVGAVLGTVMLVGCATEEESNKFVDFKLSDLPRGEWCNILINCENGHDILYVNGMLIGEVDNSLEIIKNIMEFAYPEGGYLSYHLPEFIGSFSGWLYTDKEGSVTRLNLVRIYNRELEDNEVTVLSTERIVK